uniref:Uncharacterized protein n=1 Tax=Molossus molossus TaxID=27622 RepID=A0A7J8BJ54_MOLMO|nr:hypothetical protein HJG59_010459 [Molossus molossus]
MWAGVSTTDHLCWGLTLGRSAPHPLPPLQPKGRPRTLYLPGATPLPTPSWPTIATVTRGSATPAAPEEQLRIGESVWRRRVPRAEPAGPWHWGGALRCRLGPHATPLPGCLTHSGRRLLPPGCM